jgi:hypothetical protein
MRLAKLTEFRRLVYTMDSAPALRTLRARIHQIPGGTVQCGRYFVDLDEFDRVANLRAQLRDSQSRLAKHPLLEGLT